MILVLELFKLLLKLLDLLIFALADILELVGHFILFIGDKCQLCLQVCHPVEVLSRHLVFIQHALLQVLDLLLKFLDFVVPLLELVASFLCLLFHFNHLDLQLPLAPLCIV